MTPMPMIKTQVYLPEKELEELHRVARQKKRPVADLIRQAIRTAWLRPKPGGPVALSSGQLRGTSNQHDAAFDDL